MGECSGTEMAKDLNTEELTLRIAEHDHEIASCFQLMKSLRPHLADADELIARWRKQQSQSYRLLVALNGDKPLALAGFRYQENLLQGPHLYVDDLVTAEHARGMSLGRRLMDWLRVESKRRGYKRLVLDAALSNALGHRFYFRSGFLARGLHFWLDIEEGPDAV